MKSTAERVAAYFGLSEAGLVTRYELPNLDAINLIVRGILANPLRVDAQGKALAQVLLEMPLEEENRRWKAESFRADRGTAG